MDGQIFNHLNNKKSVKKNLTSSSYPTDSVGVRARACSQHMCVNMCGWWVCVLLVLLLLGKIGCCFSAQVVRLGIGSFFGERVSLIRCFATG